MIRRFDLLVRGGRHALALAVLVALVASVGGPASTAPRPDLSRIGVLAIAPFADEASLSAPIAQWGAARLGELAERGRFRVIPPGRVGEEMRRLGIRPADLLSPSQTVLVGRQVGADAVLTGRVTYLLTEREDAEPKRSPGMTITRVDVDIRVLDVGSRVNLFQDTFICQAPGLPEAAMDCVVRDVAHRLALDRR